VRRLVQLRHATALTSEAYLAEHAWVKARLTVCPRHPRGGCGLARHGTYVRKTPAGMRVTRYYCPTAHETFSLLPDCLASRFPSDLDDLERVVSHVAAARSVEAAADTLRPDIELPSAVRWIRRRLSLVLVGAYAVNARRSVSGHTPESSRMRDAAECEEGTRTGVTRSGKTVRTHQRNNVRDNTLSRRRGAEIPERNA